MGIDELDGRLLALLDAEPRLGMLECSRRLGVARGTVQARLDRLQRDGVVRGFGPAVDPGSIGYAVTAFATLEIRQRAGQQGSGGEVAEHLAAIPQVLEVHTITGPGDLLCRIVARDNAHLQEVIDRVLADPGIVRMSSVIAMSNPVPYRVLPLVAAAVGPS